MNKREFFAKFSGVFGFFAALPIINKLRTVSEKQLPVSPHGISSIWAGKQPPKFQCFWYNGNDGNFYNYDHGQWKIIGPPFPFETSGSIYSQ